jgi:hypothetical protein
MSEMSRWACAALLVVGCGHAAPPPTPPPGNTHVAAADAGVPDAPKALEDDLPRLAERAVALFQAWVSVLDAAGEDCALATTKLNQLAVEYADVIEANRKIAHAGHDKIKQLRAELAKHDEELDAAAKTIAGSKTMAKCAPNKAFSDAIDRVGGSP